MTDVLGEAEIVLVSYRSAFHVKELIERWPDGLRVALVDNAHNADQLREFSEAHSNMRYVDGRGTGFARAANLAVQSSTSEFVVFVNPDSRPAPEDLVALVEGLLTDPQAAAHAATMVGFGGDVEIGVGGWEPSVRRTFVFALGLHKLWPEAGLYAKPDRGQSLPVDWTTGACMAVRRTTFLELGGFDESFFVYSEDTAFGRQARDAGRYSVLRSDVLVNHGAGSSGAPSLEMYRLRGASFAGYVRRYHPRVSAGVMRFGLASGSLLRAGARRLRGDRSAARAFVALASGIITGRAFVQGQEVAQARFREVTERATSG